MAGGEEFGIAKVVPGKDDRFFAALRMTIKLRMTIMLRMTRAGVNGLAFAFLEEIHGGSTFSGAVVKAGVDAYAEDAAEFFCAERSERLEGDSKVCAQLQACIKD